MNTDKHKYIKFKSVEALEDAAVDLLARQFTLADERPHAVMLTGGNTPLGIYRRLAAAGFVADANLHILLSDERHVPLESEANNYAKMRPMIAALGIDEHRVMRVRSELELNAAAADYDRRLAEFFAAGGRITLGILGLGADGHVASLFTPQDVARGKGRLAIAVPRGDGPNRVSVTADLLRRAERLVFLVAGEAKKSVARDFIAQREDITAVQALEGCRNVELWQEIAQNSQNS